MSDIYAMSPEQIREEARRRVERREKKLPLAETLLEKSQRMEEEDDRAEKVVQRNVWKLYRAFGCDVFTTSQYRKSKVSLGLPDLIVFHKRARRGWFHETKTAVGKQSSPQEYFEECAEVAKIEYVLGGMAAAEEQLIKIGIAERQPDGSIDFKHTASATRESKIPAALRSSEPPKRD